MHHPWWLGSTADRRERAAGKCLVLICATICATFMVFSNLPGNSAKSELSPVKSRGLTWFKQWKDLTKNLYFSNPKPYPTSVNVLLLWGTGRRTLTEVGRVPIFRDPPYHAWLPHYARLADLRFAIIVRACSQRFIESAASGGRLTWKRCLESTLRAPRWPRRAPT